ncbi:MULTISPECIES: malonic semialdehyde reductase [Glutamicibacter]|uniref:Dihydropteridine reductase family protein n=1 Tax=Glutamicibacter arilaitensis (strain DSM 16368 / CIP 108037 / IAM 15318 / JCM 13566 / NCIMB 14258 / Re117) TaxID=861360 RepID=A0ABM9PTQ3_GLUAR|nr:MULTISPECIES: malonic semialdehyde reductase [Glutamicibacter]CBT74579.1 dihydropteridine reductase family protein [Glutamicibacter arilaitensis Re117]HCH47544.1 malonic semialdehyde reductase [Glutamicibacter sp.]
MSIQVETNHYESLTIPQDAADQLFFDARSANSFSDEPVSDEVLDAIYEATKMGPTMMNNQPLRITWIKSEQARQAIAGSMAGRNAEKALSAPALAVLSFDTEWHEEFENFFPHAPERKEMFQDLAMRTAVGNNNAWLQAGYFIMGVRAAGLAAGPMGGFDSTVVDAAINAENNHKSFLIVNVGKPGENAWHDRLPRHDASLATRSV